MLSADLHQLDKQILPRNFSRLVLHLCIFFLPPGLTHTDFKKINFLDKKIRRRPLTQLATDQPK